MVMLGGCDICAHLCDRPLIITVDESMQVLSYLNFLHLILHCFASPRFFYLTMHWSHGTVYVECCLFCFGAMCILQICTFS